MYREYSIKYPKIHGIPSFDTLRVILYTRQVSDQTTQISTRTEHYIRINSWIKSGKKRGGLNFFENRSDYSVDFGGTYFSFFFSRSEICIRRRSLDAVPVALVIRRMCARNISRCVGHVSANLFSLYRGAPSSIY